MPQREFINYGKFGGNTAIISGDDGHHVSYDELDDLTAKRLQSFGEGRKLLFVEARNTIASVVDYLAALRGGHVIHLLENCDTPQAKGLIDEYRPNMLVQEGQVTSLHSDTIEIHPELTLLLSTSGSTGSPKFVKLSAKSLRANANSICQYLSLSENDRAIAHLPLSYSFGMSIVNSHLLSGGSLVLTDYSFIDAEFWTLLRNSRATSFSGVPHNFEILRQQSFDPVEFPDLRYVSQAGGRLAADIVQQFARSFSDANKQFFVMYGQTEAAPRIAYLPPELAHDNPGSIGVGIPGGELALLSDNGEMAREPGATGQLAYRGPNVMMGYATCQEDLATDETPDWLLTGDIGRISDSGLYEIVGRASRFVKPLGLRIDLDEVERFVKEFAPESAVVGSGDRLIIAVEKNHRDHTIDKIVQACHERYNLPRSFLLGRSYDLLPRLASGKPDYQSISADDRSSASRSDRRLRAAFDVIGRQLLPRAYKSAGLSEEISLILGRDVGPSQSIMDVGIDSLNYVQVSLAIEDRLGTLPSDWENLPISKLEEMSKQSRDREFLPSPTTDPDVLLRALAITGVVLTHALSEVLVGGAYLLLALAGTMFARFQHARLVERQVIAALSPLLKIAFAYYLILLAYQVARGDVHPMHWIMLANFSPRLQAELTLLPYFWFINAFLQIALLQSLLFLIRPYRRFSAGNPWAAAIVTLAASFAVAVSAKFVISYLGVGPELEEGHFQTRTPIFLFYVFVFGWCLHFADSLRRKAILSVIGVVMLPFVSGVSVTLWLLVGVLAAMWIPGIPLPRALRSVITVVASASFYIFIIHMIPVQLLRSLDEPTLVHALLAIIASLALGIVLARFATLPTAVWRTIRNR